MTETSARAPRRPRARRPRRRTLVLGAAGLAVVAVLPFLVVQGVGRSHVAAPDDVPASDAVVVLGAGLRPDGSPSTYLRRRLDAAADLHARGVAPVILVSGDAHDDYDEPASMRAWLLDRGVPDDAILLDRGGYDTHATCTRAVDEFGFADAVVVTQGYHLPRALFSCRVAGLDAVGVGVSAASVEPWKAVLYRVREVPAAVKALLDAVVR
ncbi:ElyC/SanA/YdcF family protein [Cellulosimicrobium sp. Marseille-Q4280]|uniref:SanA/YdcF family protein n=1 Tax=Cellulosimicrobium sp. Marseille-Q4280 TaxID=2937992 RepID=UPI00203AC153|nr:ElyC/SanA/YdcF family protein [Cellulosimicrobium sp. Marseille-Q4280]